MDVNSWKTSQRKYGVAIVNFKPSKTECLCLTVGDVVHIVEEYGSGQTGWFRGHLLSNRNQMGIFPKMFIHTKDCEVENPGQYETVTSKEDAVSRELIFTLREWWLAWKKLYLRHGQTVELDQIYNTMNDLILLRGKLLSNMLTENNILDVKDDIADRVDWGNGRLGMDLIPRVEGQQVDVDKCSIVKLYRVHLQSAEHAKSPQPKPNRLRAKSISESGLNTEVFNVVVNFKISQCNVGDESQIVMSVYDARDQKFVSEQFEIRMNKNGAPVRQEKINNCFGIFTDLPLDEYEKYLYIVIRIYRFGRMFTDNSKKSPTRPYRRPFGVGVLSIEEAKDNLKDNTYVYTVNISCCTDNEGAFPDLHKELIKKMSAPSIGSSVSSITGSIKSSTSITPTKSGSTVGMSLTFDISIFDGDLQAVKNAQPLLFQKDIAVIPKLSQFDIINPGEVRNDIYLTLMEAQFERGNKKSQKNVEVVVSVFSADGKPIDNCIYHGCGEAALSKFSSCVYYHDNTPKWQETVKISLPMDVLPGSRIRFDVYHCQARKIAEKKLYGFGFITVTNDLQIVIKDGSHNLSLFKCDDEKKIKFEKYSKMCFLVDDYGDNSKPPVVQMAYERHLKDYLNVKTLLCSTKFTQTCELLGVLNWREEKTLIETNLERLMTVQGTEIMKFLQNIMDRLLEMLDDGCQSDAGYCPKVFQVIVFMLNLLLDTRFENFRPVYEDYLQKSFSFPNVYKHLMNQFALGICQFCEGKPFTLSMSMKVLGELMSLIKRSRQLEINSPFYQKESELDFKKRLQLLFENMGRLLNRQEERLKISQMELLSNLHKCYDPLMELICKRELADLVRDVITQLPKAKDLVLEIRRTKMEFIQKTVNSDLFRDDESRGTLLPLCLNHIKACLIERYFLDTQIATSTLGDILETLFNLKETKNISQDINTLALSLFSVLTQSISRMAEGDMASQPPSFPQVLLRKPTISESSSPCSTLDRKSRRSRTLFQGLSRPLSEVLPNRDDKFLGEMVSCLTELLRLMEEPHYTAVIQIYPKGPPLKDFLTQVLHTFQELIKPEMLSSDWTIMRMETNNVIFSAVEYFSQALKNEFLEGEYFDQHLWNLYFNLAVDFIVQPSLQLEKYTESRRNKFIERYHDMRVMMGHQIQTLWEKLGTNRRYFIPSMIGPFLKVTLVPEKELRTATLPIFFDMIHCEQKTSGNFVMVEKEIIEKLDMFITMDNQGDEEYKELFRAILLERVQSEPVLKDTGSQFIVSVTSLLEKLLDYRQVYDGEENRDKRMQCTFNILNFYRDNKDKRREMYTQYIKKLYDLHCSSRNYVEAGLTLQLYVQLLEWKNVNVHSEMGFPPEPQCERKEKLLLEIIECFDKGKLWEYGIPVCKDLAAYYESQLMYRKLSKILQKEASFFTKILDGVELKAEGQEEPRFYPRQQPTYFRVAYYGMSFPPFVQNKAFIYRGDECLKLQDIMNQLSQEFPGAEILKSNNPVEDSIKYGQEQYIQISNVKPVANSKIANSAGQKVPREVEKFYENNDVDTFQFDRSYHQGDKDPDNEFKTLWTERTIMTTNHKFPGILQWYEVVNSNTIKLSPVSSAINAVHGACQELQISIETCRRSCSDNNMKDLSRQLNGMITAQVMGGIPKYQEAFFTEEFKASNPGEFENIETLKAKINLQLSLLEEGLVIMKKDNSESLAMLVQSLDEELKKLMKKVGYHKEKRSNTHTDLKKWDSGMGSFIDPRPGTPNSQHSSGSNRSSVISSDSRSNDREECTLIDLTPTDLPILITSPTVVDRRRYSHHFPSRSLSQHQRSRPLSLQFSDHHFIQSDEQAQSKQGITSPTTKAAQGGVVVNHKDIQPKRGTSVFIKKSKPPVPNRKVSDPFPAGVPRPPYTGPTDHIPEEEASTPPRIPAKHSTSKEKSLLSLERSSDGLSSKNTVVPPLPPRKSVLFRESEANIETNGHRSQSPSPRASVFSNSSGDTEFSPGASPKSGPPPIPSHSSSKMPAIPGGRTSSDSDISVDSSYKNLRPTSVRPSQTISIQHGIVPSIPVTRTRNNSDTLIKENNDNVFYEREPPPIPARPSRQINTSQSTTLSDGHHTESSDL